MVLSITGHREVLSKLEELRTLGMGVPVLAHNSVKDQNYSNLLFVYAGHMEKPKEVYFGKIIRLDMEYFSAIGFNSQEQTENRSLRAKFVGGKRTLPFDYAGNFQMGRIYLRELLKETLLINPELKRVRIKKRAHLESLLQEPNRIGFFSEKIYVGEDSIVKALSECLRE